jgi:hypothetical protein
VFIVDAGSGKTRVELELRTNLRGIEKDAWRNGDRYLGACPKTAAGWRQVNRNDTEANQFPHPRFDLIRLGILAALIRIPGSGVADPPPEFWREETAVAASPAIAFLPSRSRGNGRAGVG